MYEPIRDYCEFDSCSPHYILSKFCNHAHMLVNSYNYISRVWAMDCGHAEVHILKEVSMRVVSYQV